MSMVNSFNLLCSITRRTLQRSAYRRIQSAVVSSFDEGVKVNETKNLTPRENELLVEVECAGVNYSDLLMIKGRYYHQPKLSFIPGFELAGIVKSLGKNVNNFKEGDRVLCLKTGGTGAFSQECLVNEREDMIVKLPYSISSDVAASLAVSYGTAYCGMKLITTEKRGNTFLIMTGRGTIGLAAMDLAQNVFEGKVFGASNSEAKLECLRETNVLSTYNYNEDAMIKDVLKNTETLGVDYVIDNVGGDVFMRGFQCLRNGGHLLSLAFSSGETPKIDLLELHRRNATVSGVWMCGYDRTDIVNNLESILQMFDDGYLKGLKIYKYPLANIEECLTNVQSENFFGKSILTMYNK